MHLTLTIQQLSMFVKDIDKTEIFPYLMVSKCTLLGELSGKVLIMYATYIIDLR